MRYVKVGKIDGRYEDITREEARRLLSEGYTENVCSYDEMLDNENVFPFMFYDLMVCKS